MKKMLNNSAAEQGWNDSSQVSVLLDFLEREAAQDPLVGERFQAYLDERVENENSAAANVEL